VEGKGVLGVRALEEGRKGGAGGKNQSRCCAAGGGGEGEESGSRGISGIFRLLLLTSWEGCLRLFVRAWLAVVGFSPRPCPLIDFTCSSNPNQLTNLDAFFYHTIQLVFTNRCLDCGFFSLATRVDAAIRPGLNKLLCFIFLQRYMYDT
jgi:hypothetical protein